MAFRPPTPAEIDRAVRAWMETSLPSDTGLDSTETFADIEQLSLRIGRAVACQLSERALREQAGGEPVETPCPQCGRTCRVTRHTRRLVTVAGEVAYDEPAGHCGVCRRDFFPGRPKLRLDERSYSPDLQRRMAEATAASKSFEQAAATARCWADLTLCSRQLGRVVEAIGAELVEKRDAEVEEFLHHRRGPEGPDPEHELAAVFVDGGRIQTREEGRGVGVHGRRWREDKIARLQTMTTRCHPADPRPEPPRPASGTSASSNGSSATTNRGKNGLR